MPFRTSSVAANEGVGPIPDATKSKREEEVNEEVSSFDRDHAVHILRFLKVWFDMPSNVFLTAVSLLDKFLQMMKVKEKFMACLMVSCFNVAAEMHQQSINTKNLVKNSQSHCTVRDMERMSELIKKKLCIEIGVDIITVHDYITQLFSIVESLAVKMSIWPLFHSVIKKETLLCNLEVVMCNGACAKLQPAVIASVLIEEELFTFILSDIPHNVFSNSYQFLQLFMSIIDLQLLPNISPEVYNSSQKLITSSLNDYGTCTKSIHQQHLQWRYSSRVLYSTRPMWRTFSKYNSISEE